jgi:hypothetical protein
LIAGFNLQDVQVPEKMYSVKPMYAQESGVNEEQLLQNQQQLLQQIDELIEKVRQASVADPATKSTASSTQSQPPKPVKAAAESSKTIAAAQPLKPVRIEADSQTFTAPSSQTRSVLHVPVQSKLVDAIKLLSLSSNQWTTRVFAHSSLLTLDDGEQQFKQLTQHLTPASGNNNGLDVIIKQDGEASLWLAGGKQSIGKDREILDLLVQKMAALNVQVDSNQVDLIRNKL